MNNTRKGWALVLFAALAMVGGIAFNQTTSGTPLVSLTDAPLYLNGSKSKANLTLALSVETPTVGAAYTSDIEGNLNDFNPLRKYIGYFDPMVCYTTASGVTEGEYFTYSSQKASTDAPCPSGTSFDGNFLNWATTSAVDIMRYGLTGGNRVLDEGTGAGRTILERAYLPDILYREGYADPFFPMKRLRTSQIALRTPFASADFSLGIFIRNCRNRVYFAKENDTVNSASCASPFGQADASSPKLVKVGNPANNRFYQTRVLVCDTDTAANRLMVQNTETQRWGGLCFPYGSADNRYYKPVGQLQVNADDVRVSVFSYLVNDTYNSYGGVMRAPLKYLGPRQYDAAYNLIQSPNPNQEWNPESGVFIDNPQKDHVNYGSQGYPRSGAINYINQFGTLNPDAMGRYKNWDPVSELYYEAVRYLQGKQPSAEALSSLQGNASSVKGPAENFPVYQTWTDPHSGFADTQDTKRSCLRNSILTIADISTHPDRFLPGNSISGNDPTRPADTAPDLNVETWTDIVGSFEANRGASYTDSAGVKQKAFNIPANSTYRPDLDDLKNKVIGSGSYLMAGLAYFINTQTFRTDLPKARINTFTIDVNQYNRSGKDVSMRRASQLHLAAKYGGFDDSLTGNTGNPYAAGNNLAWQGSDGDARNYFLVSDPQRFLDSIADVFGSLATETSSISGVAASSQQLSSTDATAVFQGSFNPVSNDWSGRVRKFPLKLSADRTQTTVDTTPLWEASEQLTLRTKADNGASRNIVVGAPVGEQGTVQPAPFKWDNDLADAHKIALSRGPSNISDGLGAARLNYLRGDRRQEQSRTSPLLPFRSRQLVLGSIVNAGLVYQGAPTTAIAGTGYGSFRETNKARTPVVFANANDGMLHAFRDSDGSEAFAFIPGFIVPRLNAVADPNYAHRPLLDATPTVAEVQVNAQWRSVLVSGAGGGAQGIFAIDVTDPESFTKAQVMWEFTDADHTAMGNVLGKPRIARVRMNDAGQGTTTYKWMAIVPSGVNNHRSDAYTNGNANPSIFFIDLEAKPSPSAPWREGVNFWRIELPPGDNATAPGLIQITTVQTQGSGNLEAIHAGDLQGNVWKLAFDQKGVSALTTDGLRNLELVNAMGKNSDPMFVAKTSDGTRQPITSAPVIAAGFGGKRIVLVGTGKFLEVTDNSVPTTPNASLYALQDSGSTISGRGRLQAGVIDPSGAVTSEAFQFGAEQDQKEGWYLDFPSGVGERLVSEMLLDRGVLVLSTLWPAGGACGEGNGRNFNIEVLNGRGAWRESTVGLMGGPMLLNQGNAVVSESTTSGRRTATYQMNVLTQGSKGIAVGGGGSGVLTFTQQVGRMSWRQVHNHRDLVP